MSEPLWLTFAHRYLGMKEIPGAPTAPFIAGFLKSLKAWWADDETPWCGTFVAACMQYASIEPPKAWYRAKAWLDWGQALDLPTAGCVVVFDRKGGGHVAILLGKDASGRLVCLGGNQGNAVSRAAFDRTRALGFRWPSGEKPAVASLPLLAVSGPVSSNEA
ncbi:MAG: TIGR02594 family protein [Pseudomonadota bacterium]